MKNLIKTTATAIVLSATFAAPAFAAVAQSDVNQNINNVVGTDSNVFVSVDDGVATITGTYGDAGDRVNAIQAAKSTDGVERVINLAFPSS